MSELNFSKEDLKKEEEEGEIREDKKQSEKKELFWKNTSSVSRFDVRDMENLRTKILKHEDFVEKMVEVLKSKAQFGLDIEQTKEIQISVSKNLFMIKKIIFTQKYYFIIKTYYRTIEK